MLSERLYDAWNSRDPSQVVALYTTSGVRHQHSLPEARLEGAEAVGQMVAALMHSTPDFVLTRLAVLVDGEREAHEWQWDGTVQNDLGDLPGLGQEIHLRGVSLVALSGGLILREDVYWDTATLLAGAGLLAR